MVPQGGYVLVIFHFALPNVYAAIAWAADSF